MAREAPGTVSGLERDRNIPHGPEVVNSQREVDILSETKFWTSFTTCQCGRERKGAGRRLNILQARAATPFLRRSSDLTCVMRSSVHLQLISHQRQTTERVYIMRPDRRAGFLSGKKSKNTDENTNTNQSKSVCIVFSKSFCGRGHLCGHVGGARRRRQGGLGRDDHRKV